jgi:predicted DCC family thiol-disulfide oxidoreductase YuxK
MHKLIITRRAHHLEVAQTIKLAIEYTSMCILCVKNVARVTQKNANSFLSFKRSLSMRAVLVWIHAAAVRNAREIHSFSQPAPHDDAKLHELAA